MLNLLKSQIEVVEEACKPLLQNRTIIGNNFIVTIMEYNGVVSIEINSTPVLNIFNFSEDSETRLQMEYLTGIKDLALKEKIINILYSTTYNLAIMRGVILNSVRLEVNKDYFLNGYLVLSEENNGCYDLYMS